MQIIHLSGSSSRAHQAPEAFVRAEKAYRLGVAGLTTRASQTLQTAIKALDAHGHYQTRAIAMAGLVARIGCSWEKASRLLSQAAERSDAVGEHAEAGVYLALGVEALCTAGLIADAQRLAEGWASRGVGPSGRVSDLANVVLHLVKGHLTEAVQLAATVAKAASDSPLASWARLLELEGKLDLGRALEVEKSAAQLLEQVEKAGEFNELYQRTVVVNARAAVESLWVTTAQSTNRSTAQAAVKEALDCCVGSRRYRGVALCLAAQLRELERPGTADTLFQEATALFDTIGDKLDLGLALGRRALMLHLLARASVRPVIARGRDLLTRIGADSRSQSLAQVEAASGEDATMSALGSQSLLGRSMMGAVPGGDDVELQAVFKVNEAISSILELDPLLQRILDEVVKVLKAERGVLIRRMPDGSLRPVAVRGILSESIREGGEEISFSVLREVERTGAAILTDNAQLDARFRAQASVMAGEIRSLMCAPLKTSKELYGFVYLDSTLKARVFKDTHRELLGVFATQAAVAIEKAVAFSAVEDLNANLEQKVLERTDELTRTNSTLASKIEELTQTRIKLLEAQNEAVHKELLIARKLQQSVLPARNVIQRPGVALVGNVEPATEVGGDFWSHLPLPDGTTIVIVGDATGHGLGPGILTTVAKACCDTVIRQKGKIQLTELLPVLSDVLFESARGELTMTAFALMVDPTTRTLTYANCGHALPLYVEAAGGLPRLTALTGAGKVLGRQAGLNFDTKSRAYLPGDRILLFTDGLVECTNAAGAEFGQQRLSRVILENALLPIEQHLTAILDAAHAFWATHPRADDVTAVLLKLDEGTP